MNLRKNLLTGGVAASLMASLFAVSMAGPAIAATASPLTTTVIPDGSATNVPIATVTAIAPTDIPVGTLTLSLPAGYSWAATGAIATVATGGNLAVSGGAITLGGTTATFTVSGAAVAGSTIAFSSPTVKTTTGGASGAVVLSGLANPSSVVVARVRALFGPYGSAIVYYASATNIPADGSSWIQLTFAGGATVPSAGNAVTITTTAGHLTASSGLTFLSAPTYPVTSLSGITGVAAGASITLQSAMTPGNAIVTVQIAPIAGGTSTTDSVTTFHFTGGNGRNQDNDRGKGHGAHKGAFFLNPSWSCATGAQPIDHAATFGFAILNTTGHHRLNVNVVLKGAQPNATYDVWINQDPGGCPLGTATKVGAVHTNARGNGTANLHVALVSDATHFWVSATSGTSVLRTRAATLTIKH